MRALALLVVVAGGCIDATLVQCPNGIACPSDRVCDDAHGSCVAQEQLDACVGQPDNTQCDAVDNGGCFDQVCLTRGCGNGFVEPDEVCDDGNRESGDHCSADCRSNEACGNGFLDGTEECDDGNLLSRDGCDSRCLRETDQWQTVGLAVQQTAHTAVWDPVRARLVVLTSSATWELVAGTWHVIPGGLVGATTSALYFDPDRGQVVAVVINGNTQISTWDGATWTTLAQFPVTGDLDGAAYDPVRHVAVIVSFDGAKVHGYQLAGTNFVADTTRDYQQPSAQPCGVVWMPELQAVVANFCVAQSVLVLAATTWNGLATPEVLQRDARLGVVGDHVELAIGPHLYRYGTNDWQRLPADLPLTASGPELVYGDNAGRAEVVDSEGRAYERATLASTAWDARGLPHVYDTPAIAASPDGHGFLVRMTGYTALLGPDQLFAADANAVTPIVEGGAVPTARHGAIWRAAPGRHGILYGAGALATGTSSVAQHDLSRFDGNTWSTVGDTRGVDLGTDVPTAWDPERHAMVMLTPNALYSLRDTETTIDTDDVARFLAGDVARDARRHLLVATYGDGTAGYGQDLAELVGSTWTRTLLKPDGMHAMIADERTGGLAWVAVTRGTNATDVWDRIDGTWTPGTDVPGPIAVDGIAYQSSTGALAVSGSAFGGTVVMIRKRTSATPDETCVDGEDADGDGLAKCADPDCYWACGGCPPYATCQ